MRKKSIWAKDKYFKAIKCEKCNFISIDPCITQDGLNFIINLIWTDV